MTTARPNSRLSRDRRDRALREGVSFRQFVELAEVNQESLSANYDAYEVTADGLAFLERLSQPVDVLVLVHDWCGDVVANLPLFGKIASTTDKLKLTVLNRDPDNRDIADAYLHPDGKSHIPTYIFFDASGEELGVFIERPEEITVRFGGWIDEFWSDHPELEGRGKPIGELEETSKKGLLAHLKTRRSEVRALEQEAILKKISEIVGH
ncbi:thioredoxin family protein [Cohnella endophytica]|uniref:Thioredoxin family protein n=1 Tax=Cohnella endophytica TaxID=2419778 RepID=A0A494Y3N1_9BACL|nr:thioredoxin family protein [Cohnella endophytica]RKP57304.1 thioredoxin family protein [Cohnella endophytica]